MKEPIAMWKQCLVHFDLFIICSGSKAARRRFRAPRRCGRRVRTGNLDGEIQEPDQRGPPGRWGWGRSCVGGESLIVALVVRRCLVEATLPSLTLACCGQPAGSFLLADSRCLVC